jgi:hypothetical protein
MSGGIEEVWEKKNMTPLQKQKFWYVLYQGYKKNSIIACSAEVILNLSICFLLIS